MITIKKDNNIEIEEIIHSKLKQYNKQNCEWFKINKYDETNNNFLAFDDEKLVGGAIGFVEHNWYYLNLLYIEDTYRKRGIATKLINEVEEYAKSMNLTGVRTETWSFQAKEFYEKMNYEIFGKIEECPPGTVEYHLMKRIQGRALHVR